MLNNCYIRRASMMVLGEFSCTPAFVEAPGRCVEITSMLAMLHKFLTRGVAKTMLSNLSILRLVS